MMKKKSKVYVGLGIVATIVLMLIIVAVSGIFEKFGINKDSVLNQATSTSTNSVYDSTLSVVQLQTNSIKDIGAEASISLVSNWKSNGEYYAQYDITIHNLADTKIKDWTLKIKNPMQSSIVQFWNCKASVMEGLLTVTPTGYTGSVPEKTSSVGIGFIIKMASDYRLSEYTLEVERVGLLATDNTVSTDYASENNLGYSADNNTNNNTNSNTNNNTTNGNNTGSTNAYIVPAASNDLNGTPVGIHGQLLVKGTDMVDSSGNPYQLRGVSTHGIAWFPQYVNYDAFKTLRDEWGANVIRLAMYTEEYGGYCNGGDQNALKQLIDDGVRYATELGMYVIIDWHILSDYNPQTNKADAIAFFDEMATKYANYSNVIYEVCNEPQQSGWITDIKPYAESVIATIRSHDSNAIVLVGTNTWSQDVDAVIGNTINDANTMYVLHFYAGTHLESLRNRLLAAKQAGVPIFVSECSICDASGNGGINYESANSWLQLMNDNNISFIAWSLSNKNETSALINPSCTALSGWSESDLSDTGKWFKTAIGKK